MIRVENLKKEFSGENGSCKALDGVDLHIKAGEVFGIIGMSGAGKSTLLRCFNLLERPTEGMVSVGGEQINTMSEAALRKARSKIGMIFQSFHLLMQATALENVCFPLRLMRMPKKTAIHHGLSLLELVGLTGKESSYPSQLSGGQKQRVAIARALANEPKILLCDEATSALDTATTKEILSLLKDINRKTGITIVIVTHQMSVVQAICDRVAVIDGGKVAECGPVNQVFHAPKSPAAQQLLQCSGEELPQVAS